MMSSKHWVLMAGALFCASGLVVMMWLYFAGKSDGRWDIRVTGTKVLAPGDISEVVTYLLQNETGRIPLSEIESALQLNPRIESARAKVESGNVIEIEIAERESCCLVHYGSQVQEHGEDGKVLEEDRTSLQGGIVKEMPIFYLTADAEEKKELDKIKRDIIQLWKETGSSHGFLWQRISEIQLGAIAGELLVYPVSARAKIRLQLPFNTEKLARLWAVFFFLEKEEKMALRWNEISLTDKNAVIREQGKNGG